jgi:hypothetical protein
MALRTIACPAAIEFRLSKRANKKRFFTKIS